MAVRDGLRTAAKLIRGLGVFSAAFFSWIASDAADPNWRDFFLINAGVIGLSWTLAWIIDKFAE